MKSLLCAERKNTIAVVCCQPRKGVGICCGAARLVVGKARRKLSSVRRTCARVDNPVDGGHVLDLDRIPLSGLGEDTGRAINDITLATVEWPVTEVIEWKRRFADVEDSFALNRFIWLLRSVVENRSRESSLQAVSWIGDWIDRMGTEKSHPAWESYSIAERLANWPLILAIARKHISLPVMFLGDVSLSMYEQLEHLMVNLEDHGTLTNNHILNDARALYIGGVVLRNEKAVEKARHLFEIWTPRLISADGILREHSSHYQYLLTQRYEQVYLVAKHVNDDMFAAYLRPWMAAMRNACQFFSGKDCEEKWEMPLFGDVSPDVPPSWFSDNRGMGWSVVRNAMGWDISDSNAAPEGENALQRLGCCFYRYNVGGDAVIIWHAEDGDGAVQRGHGHYDLGGFVFYLRGKLVLADSGRYSYTRSGSYGKTAGGHNTVVVDGIGAECEEPLLAEIDSYGKRKVRCETVQSDKELRFTMSTDGFMRLRSPVRWEREFRVGDKYFIIEDRFDAVRRNRVETRFHCGPSVRVKEDGTNVHLHLDGGGRLRIIANGVFNHLPSINRGAPESKDGWYCSEYGRRVPAATIKYEAHIAGKVGHRYEVRW